jgi:hypothetical protein
MSKSKSAQSFRGAHKGRVCVHVFIKVGDRTCTSIYVYTVFLRKKDTKYLNTAAFECHDITIITLFVDCVFGGY